ncbi:CDP-glycerol--glycerophosphate glycerophosphotransferase [Coprothermobacteraceae bacterium]|nr:CDP-glycerol--glycerophosphate glycerophosphotransferase [Coprothermobacteraceae bacterium]
MQVGFLCTSPFHYYLFEPVKRHLENSAYVLVESHPKQYWAARSFFKDKALDAVHDPSVVKQFDVLVAPFLMPLIYAENPDKVFVRMVYGLSKATWNYGWWNMFFDLFLVYGDYDAEALSFYGPTVKVGNPKFDAWFQGEVEKYPKPTDRKTVLYLPTYDELSTLHWVLPLLNGMGQKYNVLVKAHHGTDHKSLRKAFPDLTLLGSDVDILSLLAAADVVVSDYSGAIFDAVLADKPLVLADLPNAETFPSTHPSSLEHKIRATALHTSDPEALEPLIERALTADPYLEERRELSARLFAYRDGNSGYYAARAIVAAHKDERPQKTWVRKALEGSLEFRKDLLKKKAERVIGRSL